MQTEPRSSAMGDGIASRRIDRRRFLETAAWGGAVAGLAGGIVGEADAAATTPAASTNARLPDGTEFPRWEQPLTFRKTYYVDGAPRTPTTTVPATAAGRSAPSARPPRCCSRASGSSSPPASTANACVPRAAAPARPQMISYEAAPGAKVYIRGSEVLKDGWTQETVADRRRRERRDPASPSGATTCRQRMFPDVYNPFALPSIMGVLGVAGHHDRRHGALSAPPRAGVRRRQAARADGAASNELAMPNLRPCPTFRSRPVPQNGHAAAPPRRRDHAGDRRHANGALLGRTTPAPPSMSAWRRERPPII